MVERSLKNTLKKFCLAVLDLDFSSKGEISNRGEGTTHSWFPGKMFSSRLLTLYQIQNLWSKRKRFDGFSIKRFLKFIMLVLKCVFLS